MADPIVSKYQDPMNPKSAQLSGGAVTPFNPTGAVVGPNVGDLVDYGGANVKMTQTAPVVREANISGSRDPLNFLLNRGLLESQNPMQLATGFDSNQYQFGSKNSLGMGDPLTSALRGKMAKAYSGTVNDIRDKYYRTLPLEQAKRNKVYQSLADSAYRRQLSKNAQDDAKAADKKAKRQATNSAILGTGGAIVGGMVGGPAGAQVGAGVGGAAGSNV